MLKIPDVELLFAREPPLNVHDYPEMVKVGFEDHFVQVIYLCSSSEKENKSIWNVQTPTNAALLYMPLRQPILNAFLKRKLCFPRGLVMIAARSELMNKFKSAPDGEKLWSYLLWAGSFSILEFNSFKMIWRQWYILKRFGKLETNLLYSSFKTSWCVLVGSYVKYDLQFPEVQGLLLTFNSIAGSQSLYWKLSNTTHIFIFWKNIKFWV